AWFREANQCKPILRLDFVRRLVGMVVDHNDHYGHPRIRPSTFTRGVKRSLKDIALLSPGRRRHAYSTKVERRKHKTANWQFWRDCSCSNAFCEIKCVY